MFYEQHLLLTVEYPQKILKKHSTRTEVQKIKYSYSKWTTAENEIVPLQHYSFSCIDTFHFSLSPTGKIAVSFAKRSSSSYKQTFTKLSREKAPSHSYFQIFKLQFATLGLPPLSSSQLQCFKSFYALFSNWQVFKFHLFVAIHLVFSFACPSSPRFDPRRNA